MKCSRFKARLLKYSSVMETLRHRRRRTRTAFRCIEDARVQWSKGSIVPRNVAMSRAISVAQDSPRLIGIALIIRAANRERKLDREDSMARLIRSFATLFANLCSVICDERRDSLVLVSCQGSSSLCTSGILCGGTREATCSSNTPERSSSGCKNGQNAFSALFDAKLDVIRYPEATRGKTRRARQER